MHEAAYWLLGVWKGLALRTAGSVAGSVLVFAATKRWAEPPVKKLVGKVGFYKYVGSLDPKGWWHFAILLLLFKPDDAVCVLARLSALTTGSRGRTLRPSRTPLRRRRRSRPQHGLKTAGVLQPGWYRLVRSGQTLVGKV